MKSYLPVRKSQVGFYQSTALYNKNREGDFVLYKSEDRFIDAERYAKELYPQLYVVKKDKESAVIELRLMMRKTLVEKVASGTLDEVKSALCNIVNEAITSHSEDNLSMIPETIDIMYDGYAKASSQLKGLIDISYGGYSLVEHSVNVMSLALNYCLFCNFNEKDAKKISLGALLHDIGLTKVKRRIVEADRKLTEQEYKIFQTHSALGHDIVKQDDNIDSSIAVGILEHHERIDGSGYPRGIAGLSVEGRLIGLIDSFEHLSGSRKIHREMKNSFSALSLIQNEVIKEGKFDRGIFKDLCLSLGRK